MWPWRRRRATVQRSAEDSTAPAAPRAADSADPAGSAPALAPPAAGPTATAPPATAPSPPAWQSLPVIQRTTADDTLLNAPGAITSSLAAWQNPSYLGQLGHIVGSNEPSGVLHGFATPLAVPPEPPVTQPRPMTDVTDAPLAAPPVGTSATPVQRRVADVHQPPAPVPVQPLMVSRLTSAPPVPPLAIDLPVVPAPAAPPATPVRAAAAQVGTTGGGAPAPAGVVSTGPEFTASSTSVQRSDSVTAVGPEPSAPEREYPVQRAADPDAGGTGRTEPSAGGDVPQQTEPVAHAEPATAQAEAAAAVTQAPVAQAEAAAGTEPPEAVAAEGTTSAETTAPTLGLDSAGAMPLPEAAPGPAEQDAPAASGLPVTGGSPGSGGAEGGPTLVVSRSVADPDRSGPATGRVAPLLGTPGSADASGPPNASAGGTGVAPDTPGVTGPIPASTGHTGGGVGADDLPLQRSVDSAPSGRERPPRRLGLGEPIVPPMLPLAGGTGPTGPGNPPTVSRFAVPGAPPPGPSAPSSPAPPASVPSSPAPPASAPPSSAPPASASAPSTPPASAPPPPTVSASPPSGHSPASSASGDGTNPHAPAAETAGLLGDPITVSRLADGTGPAQSTGPSSSGPGRTGSPTDHAPFDAPLVGMPTGPSPSASGPNIPAGLSGSSSGGSPAPADTGTTDTGPAGTGPMDTGWADTATAGESIGAESIAVEAVSLQTVRPEMAPTLGGTELPLAAAGAFQSGDSSSVPTDGTGSSGPEAGSPGDGESGGVVGAAPPAAAPLVVARLVGDRSVEVLPRTGGLGPSRFLPSSLPPAVQRVRWESASVPGVDAITAHPVPPRTGSAASSPAVGGPVIGGPASTGAGHFAAGGGTTIQRLAVPGAPQQSMDLPAVASPQASGGPVLTDPPLPFGGSMPAGGSVVPSSGRATGLGGTGAAALPVTREFSWVGATLGANGQSGTAGGGGLPGGVVQRLDDPTPPPEPPLPPSPPSDASEPAEPLPEAVAAPQGTTSGTTGPQAVSGGAAAIEPEELLKKLFDPLLRRIKTELRLDRERQGLPGGPG